jgi:hypothetical protein
VCVCVRACLRALVTTLYVASSVGSSTCGRAGVVFGSCFIGGITVENVGRSVRGWVGFVCSSCGEDNRVCEVIVFERVGR